MLFVVRDGHQNLVVATSKVLTDASVALMSIDMEVSKLVETSQWGQITCVARTSETAFRCPRGGRFDESILVQMNISMAEETDFVFGVPVPSEGPKTRGDGDS